MIEQIKDVYSWLEAANLPAPSVEQIQEWSNSEIEEFKEALTANDTEEMADAISDEIIFALNKGFFYGVTAEQLAKRFEKVLKSNWTKYASTEEEAIESVIQYRAGLHFNKFGKKIDTNYHKVFYKGKLYFVIKEIATGKILKSLSFIDSQHIEI